MGSNSSDRYQVEIIRAKADARASLLSAVMPFAIIGGIAATALAAVVVAALSADPELKRATVDLAGSSSLLLGGALSTGGGGVVGGAIAGAVAHRRKDQGADDDNGEPTEPLPRPHVDPPPTPPPVVPIAPEPAALEPPEEVASVPVPEGDVSWTYED